MARKKVREYDGKRLVIERLRKQSAAVSPSNPGEYAIIDKMHAIQIRDDFVQDPIEGSSMTRDESWQSYLNTLAQENPWVMELPLVVKPDMLFGKRGKSDLVLLNADWKSACEFIMKNLRRELSMGGITGVIDTLIVEPFVKHSRELYLCIQSVRSGELISFGDCGGVEIESNWHLVKSVNANADELQISNEGLETLLSALPESESEQLYDLFKSFIVGCFDAFRSLDLSLLEMNPFTVSESGLIVPLDMRVEVDSYAHFKNMLSWGDLEFPEPWGRVKLPEEKFVQSLDDKSGASLKLSVLNAKGRIWTMVAGGGASVVYADTVVDLGFGDELANYAEYSGNPKQEETYLYARTLLSLATRNLDGRRRVLLIGGGVANFTDVAATFTGIIQALKDFAGKLQEAKMLVLVRRGGPNYEAGLRMMQQLGDEISVPISVFGPSTSMTSIVQLGIHYLTESVDT
eukprot:CAMPEP_0182444568 /NCGR_PEP_ID=MMETSP1172-20130603/2979_1 /TAXON_ID=708627 /ORGANISM="Timspurckia oligopyrenoides, Strain CCMP3278" /LENGTH=460 /DNA_ID=CAMNT_0024640157 /DNA_START=108 /DNA_END=1490 /DNA_ORIENTATION=+